MYGIGFILIGVYCLINSIKRHNVEQRVRKLERRELRLRQIYLTEKIERLRKNYPSAKLTYKLEDELDEVKLALTTS